MHIFVYINYMYIHIFMYIYLFIIHTKHTIEGNAQYIPTTQHNIKAKALMQPMVAN